MLPTPSLRRAIRRPWVVDYLKKRMISSAATEEMTPSSVVDPPPAGGHLPGVATSSYLRRTREAALHTPGLKWIDALEDTVLASGRETRKMNMYQGVRDALR